jgi:hypothetical protein
MWKQIAKRKVKVGDVTFEKPQAEEALLVITVSNLFDCCVNQFRH